MAASIDFLTVGQRGVISELFASADEYCERATVEELLDDHTIDGIIPLNEQLEEYGGDEPGDDWNGYAAVIYAEGRRMFIVSPLGDVMGDIPGQ